MNTPKPLRALAALLALVCVLGLSLVAQQAQAAGHHPGQVTRTRGPLMCGSVACHRDVTITRPWLDTEAVVTIVKRHSRPVEGRNSLPAPWGPFRILVAYVR